MRDTALWREWNIHHIATHRNGAVITRIAMFVYGSARFIIELLFQRPDVVHIHTSSYGSFVRKFILTWIAVAFRVPVVLHVHGSEFHRFFDNVPRSIQALIRATLERVDAVIALGSAWADRIEHMAPRASIVVVPNAIRPNRAVEHLASGPVHVVFLGEICERKGTFFLLRSWAKMLVSSDVGEARLTVAGDGELGHALDLVAELAIGATVKVIGWLPPTDVSQLLASAHVLVLPSLNEGQPMAILEAMARGLCVVASNAGGIPEMVGEGGVLVDPEDESELCDALTFVLTDHCARAQFGASALQRVKREFDVDVISERFDQLYRRIAVLSTAQQRPND